MGCVVSGLAKSGKWGNIATLPSSCRPSKRLIFNVNNHVKSARVDVQTSGVVSWIAGGKDHQWISLTGILFPVTPAKPKPRPKPRPPTSSPLVCKTHVKSSNNAGVIRPNGAPGYTLVGGGMNNHYRSFNKLSAFEEAFPHGNQFQCDTGFGPGRLTCYARYCKKTGMRCTTNKTSRQRKSGVAVANAPRGYTMTGGGLYNHYRHFNKKAHFERSHPHSNGWTGDMGYGWGDYTVYARSCTKLSCRTVHSGVANAAHANCPRGYQVMSCGSHQMNGWGHLGAFEQYQFHGNGCLCDMGFGSGKQRCYARCCK